MNAVVLVLFWFTLPGPKTSVVGAVVSVGGCVDVSLARVMFAAGALGPKKSTSVVVVVTVVAVVTVVV